MRSSAVRVAEGVCVVFVCWLAVRFSTKLWPNILSHHGDSAVAAAAWLALNLLFGALFTLAALALTAIAIDEWSEYPPRKAVLALSSVVPATLAVLILQWQWMEAFNKKTDEFNEKLWMVRTVSYTVKNYHYLLGFTGSPILAAITVVISAGLIPFSLSRTVHRIYLSKEAGFTIGRFATIAIYGSIFLICSQLFVWLLFYVPGYEPWIATLTHQLN